MFIFRFIKFKEKKIVKYMQLKYILSQNQKKINIEINLWFACFIFFFNNKYFILNINYIYY